MLLNLQSCPQYSLSAPFFGEDAAAWMEVWQEALPTLPLFLVKHLRNECIEGNWVEGLKLLEEHTPNTGYWDRANTTATASPLAYSAYTQSLKAFQHFLPGSDFNNLYETFAVSTPSLTRSLEMTPIREEILCCLLEELAKHPTALQNRLALSSNTFESALLWCRSPRLWALAEPFVSVDQMWEKESKKVLGAVSVNTDTARHLDLLWQAFPDPNRVPQALREALPEHKNLVRLQASIEKAVLASHVQPLAAVSRRKRM